MAVETNTLNITHTKTIAKVLLLYFQKSMGTSNDYENTISDKTIIDLYSIYFPAVHFHFLKVQT